MKVDLNSRHRVRTKRPCGVKLPCLFYQYPYEFGNKVLLKQICQSVRLHISRHFEKAHLFVAFLRKFKHFMQFSINQAG